MSEPCFVYIIKAFDSNDGENDIFKVGMSANVEARFKTIANASPYKLRVAVVRRLPHREAARFVEGYMHAALRPFRTNGEWFKTSIIGAACSLDYGCIEYFMGTDAEPVTAGENDFERLPEFLIECGTPEEQISDLILSQYGELPLCLTGGTEH